MPGKESHSVLWKGKKAAVVTLPEGQELSRESKWLLWYSAILAATKTVNMWS